MAAAAVIALVLIACVISISKPWWGVVAFYFFTFLIPEWNWRWAMPAYFPYPTMITSALIFGVLLNGFRDINLKPKLLSPVTGLLLFIGLAFVSSWSSIAPELSDFYLRFLWKIILMACLAIALIDTPRKMIILLIAICVAQAYNSFQINLQYFQDGFSAYARDGWAFGRKGDNNIYSSFTIPMMAGSLALGFCAKSLWMRLLFLLACGLAVHQIMLLESRGAMLGSAMTILVMVTFVRKNKFTISMMAMGAVLASFWQAHQW